MKRRVKDLGVVASVQDQTEQAEALAAIAGQARLADPRTNPATRAHADRLRNDQHLKALDAEHSRLLRRHRVAGRRSEEAERTLEAMALAQRASSPARSVLALHVGKRRRMRLCLAASLVLGVGSALGLEAASQALKAPWGSGYIAEVGLTGLATAAITYRAHLGEHRGELVKGSWQSRALWAGMTVPLLISVACNLATFNAIGAFCAISAAAWSLLACVVADRSSAAMQARAEEVSAEDELEIRRVAVGDDDELFTPVAAGITGGDQAGTLPAAPAELETPQGPAVAIEAPAAPADETGQDSPETDDDPVADEASAGLGELTAWLADQDPPDGATTADLPGPSGGPDAGGLTSSSDRAHIDADRREESDGAARVLPAAEARRAIGAATLHRVSAYLTDHPEAGYREVASELGLSEATAKRYMKVLRDGGRS
jgi:hypothetical protein